MECIYTPHTQNKKRILHPLSILISLVHYWPLYDFHI